MWRTLFYTAATVRMTASWPPHSYAVSADLVRKEMEEGEGALAAEDAEKRSPNDFALWKPHGGIFSPSPQLC